MLDETFQFQLTQYLDGALPPEETAALEARLAQDPQARALLEEYRKLDDLLQAAPDVPAIHWEALAQEISAQVTASQIARRSFWATPMRLAAAAVVLLIAGVALLSYLRTQTPAPVAVAQVEVLVEEQHAGTAVAEISIGPAPAVAGRIDQLHYAGLIARPSVVLVETAVANGQDSFPLY